MATKTEVLWSPSKTAKVKSLEIKTIHKAEANECLLLTGKLVEPMKWKIEEKVFTAYEWGWEVRRGDVVVAFGADRTSDQAKACALNVASFPPGEAAKLFKSNEATHCSAARPTE